MKIRNGFVSNSSSSSFMCDVCGETISGYDISLSDYEMNQCASGHIYCDSEAPEVEDEVKIAWVKAHCDKEIKRLKDWQTRYNEDHHDEIEELKEIKADVENRFEEYIEEYMDEECETPEAFCPICQMTEVSDSDMNEYLYKKFNLDPVKVKAEIKSTFATFEQFQTHLQHGGTNED